MSLMTAHQTLLFVTLSALLLAGGPALMLPSLLRQQRIAFRLRELRGSLGIRPRKNDLFGRILFLTGNAILRSGFVGGKTRAELEETLARACYHGRAAVGTFIAAKLGGFFIGTILALSFVLSVHVAKIPAVLLTGGGAVLGLLIPDLVLGALHKRYLRALERGLPDALDLMVICTQAGLSLEPSIERVAREIAPAHPAIAREFSAAVNEIRIASDIRAAILAFGSRAGFIGLRRLATTLVQTIQYGMPLSQSLRVLATEMRQETLTRFEARAARLSVLLTVPMIVFILPCIFLIVGGPAMIQLMKVMGH